MNSMTGDFTPERRGGRRLIALELNELCPDLLARWMADGSLPNFKRLHASSQVFTTRADVDEPALLEPWIQWYSVHTGLPYDQHRVFHLTEGKRGGHDDVYRMLLAAGRRVASFASMNVAPFMAPGSLFVGDPWSEEGDASPSELNVYNRFVSHNVREYSNASDRMVASDYARFLAFMARHGLSAATIAGIVKQLGEEKLTSRELSWRRVAILDALQFDVFRSYYRKLKPDFASFFANSVAHLQHSYWRHMDPEPYTVRPDAGEMASYGDAIRTGYMAMDGIVGRFLALAEATGARLMFLTALSQQPFLRHEELGGQHFYRLHSVEAFLRRTGIAVREVTPTMTHQYLARFASPEAAQAGRERLAAFQLDDGRQLFGFPEVETEPGSLYFGCQISTRTAPQALVLDGGTAILFGELFYRIDAIKSGRHHPDGCLWIQTGRHRVHAEKPSILDVLPTQLDLLGVPAPEGLAGRSLAKVLTS
jgi:hypothetical protein